MGILIQGGRIVDAATDTDKTGDIYLKDGIITEIGQKLKKKDGDVKGLSFPEGKCILAQEPLHCKQWSGS